MASAATPTTAAAAPAAATTTVDGSKSLTLNSGAKMPVIGLGTWQSPKGKVEAAVATALECGYRHIDGAFVYGNEAEIGTALSAAFAKGTVKREELFITTKLWSTDCEPENVEAACRLSLKNLQLDYVDLYLVHWPFRFKKGGALIPKESDMKLGYTPEAVVETWKAVEALVEKGLVKSIGICNMTVQKMNALLPGCTIKPAVVQNESHPYLQNKALLKLLGEHDIVLTAYSPLGSPSRPARYIKAEDPILLDEPHVEAIAKELGCTPAQVLIKWGVQRNTIVIPKSVTPSRIAANLASLNVELTEEHMKQLAELDRGMRYIMGGIHAPDGDASKLWDGE